MSEWEDFTESPCVRSGQLAFEPGRRHPRGHRRGAGLRRLHPHGAAHPRGPGLLQEGRGRRPSSRTASSGSAARCPPTPTAAACRPASPACGGSSSSSRRCKQLRGECGARQVPDARLACVNGTSGWFSAAGTVILGTDTRAGDRAPVAWGDARALRPDRARSWRAPRGRARLPGPPGVGRPAPPGAAARGDDRAAGRPARPLAAALPPALTRGLAADGRRRPDVKWLWALHDGARVETVLMHYPDRVTVCVSTQAGCAMACQFCATGQAGFQRQLSAGRDRGAGGRGHAGGPAASALQRRVHGDGGAPGQLRPGLERGASGCTRDMGLSARHLTLSTVGIVPGIRRLAAETLPVNLAVSLHAANDALRDELVPINRRYPLADARRGLRRLRRGHRPPPLHRVGHDRRRQRPGRRRPGAGGVRPPAGRPRQPHPAQPDARLPRASARRRDGCAASATTW